MHYLYKNIIEKKHTQEILAYKSKYKLKYKNYPYISAHFFSPIKSEFLYVYSTIGTGEAIRVTVIINHLRKVSKNNKFWPDFTFTQLVIISIASSSGKKVVSNGCFR